jgi:hypothetical protein
VIVPNSIEDQDLVNNVCIGIEFKKPTTIDQNHQQLLLEFIAAASKRSNKNLPILFVSTDFYTFKFVSFPVQRDRIIHFYQTRNLDYAIQIIKKFIIHHNSVAKSFAIKPNKPISLRSDQEEKIISCFKSGEISYFKTQEGRDLFYSTFNSIKELIECENSIVNQPIDDWIDFEKLIELLQKSNGPDNQNESGITYLKKIRT